jgi:hypothetical protein
MSLADGTPAEVGVKVVAVAVSRNGEYDAGHTGVIVRIEEEPVVIWVRWDHSGKQRKATKTKIQRCHSWVDIDIERIARGLRREPPDAYYGIAAALTPPDPRALKAPNVLAYADDFQARQGWLGLHITLSDFAGKHDDPRASVKHGSSTGRAIDAVADWIGAQHPGRRYRVSQGQRDALTWKAFKNGLVAVEFTSGSRTLDHVCHILGQAGMWGPQKHHARKAEDSPDGLRHRCHGARDDLHLSLGKLNDPGFREALMRDNDGVPVEEHQLPVPGGPSLPLPENLRHDLSLMDWELRVVRWDNPLSSEKRVNDISHRREV